MTDTLLSTGRKRQKLHLTTDGLKPCCGGGRAGQRSEWQVEIGDFADATCLRCLQIKLDQLKAADAKPV